MRISTSSSSVAPAAIATSAVISNAVAGPSRAISTARSSIARVFVSSATQGQVQDPFRVVHREAPELLLVRTHRADLS